MKWGKTDANKEGMRGGGKKMKRKPGERKKIYNKEELDSHGRKT